MSIAAILALGLFGVLAVMMPGQAGPSVALAQVARNVQKAESVSYEGVVTQPGEPRIHGHTQAKGSPGKESG